MAKDFIDRPKQAGTFLKSELKKRKITQEKFAEYMGCDVRTVGRWIHDGINQVDILFIIASFFGLENIGDIFSFEEDVPCVVKNQNRTNYDLEKVFFLCYNSFVS